MYNVGLNSIRRTDRVSWWEKSRAHGGVFLTPANIVGILGAIIILYCLLVLPKNQYWNFRVPLYLAVVVWTTIRPRMALYLLPLAIPWGSIDLLAGNLTGADILVALLATGWLLGYILQYSVALGTPANGPLDREKFNVPIPLIVALVSLLLAMVLSLTGVTNLGDSVKELVKWSELLVIILLGSQYIRTRRQLWTLAVIILLAGLSQALFGYAQLLFNLGPASFVRDASLRVYGTFGQPNPYAGYINMPLALALALMLLGHGWRTRILAACIVLPLLGVEILTQSKGGWLALGAAVLFIIFVGFIRLRILAGLVWIATLCITGAYLIGKFPVSLIEPILVKIGLVDISFTDPTPENYANSERVAHWLAGIGMFQAHPIFGVGIGNYQDVYLNYHVGIFVLPLGHAHNYYINIAAETGIVGLMAFLCFLGVVFFHGIQTYRFLNTRYQQLAYTICRPRTGITANERMERFKQLGILQNDRALAIGLMAALLSVCVHNLVDNLYVHALTSLFALLIVLLLRIKDVTADNGLSEPAQVK